MNRLAWLCLAVAFASGCYTSVDTSHAHYICGTEVPGQPCQTGVPCVQGCCGGPPCGLVYDGGGATTYDDAGNPSALPDLMPAPAACTQGAGYPVPGNPLARGCLGLGPLAAVCNQAAGYQLCSAPPMDFMACQKYLPDSQNRRLFVGTLHGSQPTMGLPTPALTCTWAGQPSNTARWLYACGGDGSAAPVTNTCSGWPVATNCKNGNETYITRYNCPQGTPGSEADAANITVTDGDHGAMCCKVGG